MYEATSAFAYESVTVADSAIGLTVTTFDPGDAPCAERALVSVETAQIRYQYDGTDPTSSVGHVAEPGDLIELDGNQNIRNFAAIRTGAVSATLRVTYER